MKRKTDSVKSMDSSISQTLEDEVDLATFCKGIYSTADKEDDNTQAEDRYI